MTFEETICSVVQFPTQGNHDNKIGSECILNTEVMGKKWNDIISQSYTAMVDDYGWLNQWHQ